MATAHALVALVLFSSLLYFTERHGPLATNFASVPESMYFTIIMMTGELPLYDFTLAGRFLVPLIAITAVAIFAVPTALLGSGLFAARHNQ